MHDDDIRPVAGLIDGTVPDAGPPAVPGPRRGRLRRVAAAAAIGVALGAGVVAVAQGPLQSSHVGSVFTATQSPDDNTAETPAPPSRSHVTTGEGHEDD